MLKLKHKMSLKQVLNLGVFPVLVGLLTGCGEPKAAPEAFPADAKGKIVLVNYWAEWCKPCREEIPELNRFVAANSNQVVLYGVNFDGAVGDELARQEQAMGIGFPTLAADPGPALGWQLPMGLPHTVVTDSAGANRLELSGVQTEKSLAKAVAKFAKRQGDQQ